MQVRDQCGRVDVGQLVVSKLSLGSDPSRSLKRSVKPELVVPPD